MLVCVHACSSVFLFSPFLPPSLCVYMIFPYPSPSLSLYPSLSLSLSLVSSDDVIPHWSDDVMPCPLLITLPISRDVKNADPWCLLLLHLLHICSETSHQTTYSATLPTTHRGSFSSSVMSGPSLMGQDWAWLSSVPSSPCQPHPLSS